jgi:hypothetical protein
VSRARGPKVTFQCSYDCELGGCPGHTLQEEFDRSTDIYTIYIDDNPVHYFDEPTMAAILKAHELSKGL